MPQALEAETSVEWVLKYGAELERNRARPYHCGRGLFCFVMFCFITEVKESLRTQGFGRRSAGLRVREGP